MFLKCGTKSRFLENFDQRFSKIAITVEIFKDIYHNRDLLKFWAKLRFMKKKKWPEAWFFGNFDQNRDLGKFGKNRDFPKILTKIEFFFGDNINGWYHIRCGISCMNKLRFIISIWYDVSLIYNCCHFVTTLLLIILFQYKRVWEWHAIRTISHAYYLL